MRNWSGSRRLDEARSEAEKARLAAEAEARERMSAEERARKEREERAVGNSLPSEAEQAKAALAASCRLFRPPPRRPRRRPLRTIVAQAEAAAAEINIDEASTRALIDEQLRGTRLGSRYPDDSLQRRNAARERPQYGYRRMADEERSRRLCAVRRNPVHRRGRGQAPEQERVFTHRPGPALRADVPLRGRSRAHRRSVAGCRQGTLLRPVCVFRQWQPLSQAARNRERDLVPRCSKAIQSPPRSVRLANAGRTEGDA